MRKKIKEFKRIIESMNPVLSNEPEISCNVDTERNICEVYLAEGKKRVSTKLLVTFAAIKRAKSLDKLACKIYEISRKKVR